MDFIGLLISVVSGAVGGNVAGAAMPDKSLGPVWNSVLGVVGGGLGMQLMHALGFMQAAGLDFGTIAAEVASGGVGGAVLMVVAAVVKHAMGKA